MIKTCLIHTSPSEQKPHKTFDEPCAGWIEDRCSHDNVKYIPIYCHSWNCPRCGPLKLIAVKIRIRHAARIAENRGLFLRLVTLTYKEDIPIRRLYSDLQHLAQAIRRRHGFFEYARFVERTRRGRPHMHLVVLSPFLPIRELSQMWRTASGGSYIVHVRRIQGSAQAAAYVTKYCCKAPIAKVTFSRNFPDLDPETAIPEKVNDAWPHRYVFWPRGFLTSTYDEHFDRHPGQPHYIHGP